MNDKELAWRNAVMSLAQEESVGVSPDMESRAWKLLADLVGDEKAARVWQVFLPLHGRVKSSSAFLLLLDRMLIGQRIQMLEASVALLTPRWATVSEVPARDALATAQAALREALTGFVTSVDGKRIVSVPAALGLTEWHVKMAYLGERNAPLGGFVEPYRKTNEVHSYVVEVYRR